MNWGGGLNGFLSSVMEPLSMLSSPGVPTSLTLSTGRWKECMMLCLPGVGSGISI